jgi:hypothetical protein
VFAGTEIKGELSIDDADSFIVGGVAFPGWFTG